MARTRASLIADRYIRKDGSAPTVPREAFANRDDKLKAELAHHKQKLRAQREEIAKLKRAIKA